MVPGARFSSMLSALRSKLKSVGLALVVVTVREATASLPSLSRAVKVTK